MISLKVMVNVFKSEERSTYEEKAKKKCEQKRTVTKYEGKKTEKPDRNRQKTISISTGYHSNYCHFSLPTYKLQSSQAQSATPITHIFRFPIL